MKEEHYFLKRDLHCFSWPTFLLLKHFFFSCLGSEVSQNCVEGNNQYHIIQLSIIIGLNKTHPQIKYFSKVKVLTFLTHANHQQLNAEMTAKTSNQVKWRCKAIDEEQRCVKYWQMLVWSDVSEIVLNIFQFLATNWSFSAKSLQSTRGQCYSQLLHHWWVKLNVVVTGKC